MKTDKKIIKYKNLAPLRKKASKEGKTIVFTSGCYDILHLGHVAHFDFCRQQGDWLVVTIGNNKTIKSLKGLTRPINDEMFRARLLAAFELIDYVVISEEFGKMDHIKSMELLRPDKYVLNADDSAINEKKELVEKNGGKLILRHTVVKSESKVLSTTRILKQMDTHDKK